MSRPTWTCSTLRCASRGGASGTLLQRELFPGILQLIRDGRDLDVLELAVDPPHLAQVFVLHDVARLRIDADRPAWTVWLAEVREQLHGALGPELAVLLVDRMHDRRHAVPAPHRNEVGRLVLPVRLL